MKQPKTVEEFMALPVRSIIAKDTYEITPENRAELEVKLGRKLDGWIRTINVPRVRPAYAVCYEPDTIMFCDGYVLHLDDEGFCRAERL
jgi:hypothetical protein